jgi:hypothetical protein
MPSIRTAQSPRLSASVWNPVALFLVSASLLWCILWFVHARSYYEDDAYIHLEFARSLSRGQGFSFNGHVVYGDTSPLWVLFLDAVHAIIPGWIAAGKVLSILGVLFASAGAFAFARKLTGNLLFAFAMLLLFVVNPYFNYWAFSGMETIFAAGLAFWGVTLVSDRVLPWPRFLAASLIVGVGPVLRPEMVFLSAILAVLLLVRWNDIPGPLTAKLPGLLAGLVLAAGPTIAWSLYALHAFGRVVPNTNAAKRAAPHDLVAVHIFAATALGFPIALLGVLAGLLFLVVLALRKQNRQLTPTLRRIPLGAWVYLLWTAIASLFYVVNHTYVQTRYLFVTDAGLTLSVLAVVFLFAPRLGRAATVFAILVAAGTSFLSTWPLITFKEVDNRDMDAVSLWIRTSLPPDAPVALYNIGQVAFVSQHPVVDTGGITRPGVIPFLNGAPEDVVRWSQREGAQYFVGGNDQPLPGSTLVHPFAWPSVTWSLKPHQRANPQPFNIWKLPPPTQR